MLISLTQLITSCVLVHATLVIQKISVDRESSYILQQQKSSRKRLLERF